MTVARVSQQPVEAVTQPDDAAARVTADTKRDIEPDRPGGNDRDFAADLFPVFEAHDRALTELLVNARDRELERLALLLLFLLGHSVPDLSALVLG